ncbi:MAG: hypothetical protein BWX87_02593 [Bacteroidetes bacterium ADurb.Bin123]|nr:MAG: hypothetical protein BWX87_02593 [Bacteroidetes bacterium ADurb.Bin123]
MVRGSGEMEAWYEIVISASAGGSSSMATNEMVLAFSLITPDSPSDGIVNSVIRHSELLRISPRTVYCLAFLSWSVTVIVLDCVRSMNSSAGVTTTLSSRLALTRIFFS